MSWGLEEEAEQILDMPVNRIKPISIAGECWSYSHFQWCWFPRSQIDTEIHFYQSRPADKKVIGKSQSKKSNLMLQIEQSLFCANSGIDLSPSWGEELVSWDWERRLVRLESVYRNDPPQYWWALKFQEKEMTVTFLICLDSIIKFMSRQVWAVISP